MYDIVHTICWLRGDRPTPVMCQTSFPKQLLVLVSRITHSPKTRTTLYIYINLCLAMGVCVCVSVVYMFLRSTSEIATLYLTHRRRSEDGGIIHT